MSLGGAAVAARGAEALADDLGDLRSGRGFGPKRRWANYLRWLGVLPFTAFLLIFLLIPTGELILDAFKTPTGNFTLSNVSAIFQGEYLSAFEQSIELAALSAALGAVIGFFVINAVLQRGAPRWMRSVVVTFSGMAANFAGIPLAFAFTATIGAGGFITALVAHFGINLNNSLPLTGTFGLALVYVYFQFPLMILLMVPAVDGVKKEWREAAENLGASAFQYWRYVAMPILLPAIVGASVLLFGGAFSAYATAQALSGSTGNLVTELIANLTDGNITVDPQAAYALAFGMIVVIAVTVVLFVLMQRRSNRWLR